MPEQMFPKTIPVVFLTDDNYALPTAVAIRSLIDHWAGALPLRIYIVAHAVGKENADRLKLLSNTNFLVELIDASHDRADLERFYETGSYVSATSMLKFCIPRLLPNDDVILYLDGDVLVQKDLSPLTQIDVSNYYLAAVKDMTGMLGSGLHTMAGVSLYFNSGVLLLNAKRFREESLEERMFEIASANPHFKCMDQTVFNVGFAERVLWLPPYWNLMACNLIDAGYSISQINAFFGTRSASLAQMVRQAALIHLTNVQKPWNSRYAFHANEWLRVFRRTPFKNVSLVLYPIYAKAAHHIARKETYLQHVYTRTGPFLKDWTEQKTTFLLFNHPLAIKIKRPDLYEIRLLGIPLRSKKLNEESIITYVLGIRVQKRDNLEALEKRLSQRVDNVSRALTGQTQDVVDEETLRTATRELRVLDQLNAKRSNQP